MDRVPQAGLTKPAVAGQLERGVRRLRRQRHTSAGVVDGWASTYRQGPDILAPNQSTPGVVA
jgi:hypothetical protein